MLNCMFDRGAFRPRNRSFGRSFGRSLTLCAQVNMLSSVAMTAHRVPGSEPDGSEAILSLHRHQLLSSWMVFLQQYSSILRKFCRLRQRCGLRGSLGSRDPMAD
ncbi:hypothetical protein CMUS01_01267 [Colletotrichum musicola]|uniref:Uncharacterized protein n=1 Tax=Colletotrichum musicola TaxID=2175873 RepID=A0A8H6NXF2_9PEZI|nr:hypothetical protein CMUS01_01267 [Colletotrichum musicola]